MVIKVEDAEAWIATGDARAYRHRLEAPVLAQGFACLGREGHRPGSGLAHRLERNRPGYRQGSRPRSNRSSPSFPMAFDTPPLGGSCSDGSPRKLHASAGRWLSMVGIGRLVVLALQDVKALRRRDVIVGWERLQHVLQSVPGVRGVDASEDGLLCEQSQCRAQEDLGGHAGGAADRFLL